MVNTLKLPVGIDSFEKIRRNGFYYIDKTNLIEQILMNWGEVTIGYYTHLTLPTTYTL